MTDVSVPASAPCSPSLCVYYHRSKRIQTRPRPVIVQGPKWAYPSLDTVRLCTVLKNFC